MTGIISDIHGNYPALKAVLQQIDKAGCNKIISLGDVAGYYCMINECIYELRERNIINILGNHDNYIISNSRCERSYSANLCLDYQRKILTSENIDWLHQSVPYIKEHGYWMVHGGWKDFINEYINDYSFLDIPGKEIHSYLSGHTHIQTFIRGKYADYYNPGSVGQPRDGHASAAYAIIDEYYNLHLKRTEYDIEQIIFEMRKAGFSERISSCLYYGCKIGQDFIL